MFVSLCGGPTGLPRAFRSRLRRTPAFVGALALLLVGAISGSNGMAQALQPGGPVDFSQVPLGSQAFVTLVFSAGVPTTISSVTAVAEGLLNEDFGIGVENCTGVQNPPSSCSITIVFNPQQIGLRRGSLAIKDSTGAVVNRVPLHGIGLGGQLAYGPVVPTTRGSLPTLSPSSFKPSAALYDAGGSLYFNDIQNGRVLKQAPDGTISVLANNIPGTTQSSMAIAGEGTLYVSSPNQALVYAIAPGGTVSTLNTGSVTLVTPTGLATDGSGFLYIADAGTNKIDRIQLGGGTNAALSLGGLTTPLSSPAGLVVSEKNTLYIADSGNNRIVKLGLVSGAASVVDSPLTLSNPQGISLDGAASLYVADTGSSRLLMIPASGNGVALLVPGQGITNPVGVAISASGDILLVDNTLGLTSITHATYSINFPTATKAGTVDTVDGIKSFSVQNTGNVPAVLNGVTSGTNPSPTSKAFTATSPQTCPMVGPGGAIGPTNMLAEGLICTYSVQFTPTNTGVNKANFAFSVMDPNGAPLNVGPGVALTGVGTSSLAAIRIVASPSMTSLGAPVSFTVTALNNTGAVATDYLGTISFTSTDKTAKFLGGTSYAFTQADAGVHTFPANGGVQFNALGTFTLAGADNAFNTTSNSITVVNQPTVTLSSSSGSPVFIGTSIQLSAAVLSPGAAPTGTVSFFDNGNPLGSASLSSGVAALTVSFSAVGVHSITATYSGDPSFLPASSQAVGITAEDFTLTLTANSNPTTTVVPGTPIAWSLQLTPVGGTAFPAPITLSVTGIPAGATYSFSPTSVPANNGATNVQFTLTAAKNVAALHTPANPFGRRTMPIAFALLLAPLGFIRRRRLPGMVLLVLLAAAVGPLTGCLSDAASGYSSETPRTFTINVVATSGQLSRSLPITFTVQ